MINNKTISYRRMMKEKDLRIGNVGSEMVYNCPAIFFGVGSLQSIMLRIVGELAWGGFVAVAVGGSDT